MLGKNFKTYFLSVNEKYPQFLIRIDKFEKISKKLMRELLIFSEKDIFGNKKQL